MKKTFSFTLGPVAIHFLEAVGLVAAAGAVSALTDYITTNPAIAGSSAGLVILVLKTLQGVIVAQEQPVLPIDPTPPAA